MAHPEQGSASDELTGAPPSGHDKLPPEEEVPNDEYIQLLRRLARETGIAMKKAETARLEADFRLEQLENVATALSAGVRSGYK